MIFNYIQSEDYYTEAEIYSLQIYNLSIGYKKQEENLRFIRITLILSLLFELFDSLTIPVS